VVPSSSKLLAGTFPHDEDFAVGRQASHEQALADELDRALDPIGWPKVQRKQNEFVFAIAFDAKDAVDVVAGFERRAQSRMNAPLCNRGAEAFLAKPSPELGSSAVGQSPWAVRATTSSLSSQFRI
jgi:hypothetical protein